ncbi:MAG: GNAT family N-acetyltransferase [Promethearchaeota archaeon]
MKIRKMQQDDIFSLMKLKNKVGWNQVEDDWLRLLELNPAGCFTCFDEDKLIASVTTTYWDNKKVGWIGMLIVDEKYRGRGIGKTMLSHAVQYLKEQDIRLIMLDATPAGKALYEKQGFKTSHIINRYVLGSTIKVRNMPLTFKIDDFLAIDVENALVQGFKEKDLEDLVLNTDKELIGEDRSNIISRLFNERVDNVIASVEKLKNASFFRPNGYALYREGMSHFQLGPLVAKNTSIAVNLIKRILAKRQGKSFILDIPSFQDGFTKFVREIGGLKERNFYRMYLANEGFYNEVCNYPFEYCTSGPEKG